MWILLAAGSALFAGITSILAKLGICHTDSTLATAIRTIVVLLFSWLMVLVTGVLPQIHAIDGRSLIFLVLSGLATGASWLCYFRALQIGPVAQVAAIDKSSTVLTILLSFILLHETVSTFSAIGTLLIALGTLLMLDSDILHACKRKKTQAGNNAKGTPESTQYEREVKRTGSQPKRWIVFAFASAIFASLTSILGKTGIEGVDSNLGTAIRTIVVLVMAWMMVFVSHKQNQIRAIPKKELFYILASGVATGASWLCFYGALQKGEASVVVPIDKLSILVTILFSVVVLHEKISKRTLGGLALLVAGTLMMVI